MKTLLSLVCVLALFAGTASAQHGRGTSRGGSVSRGSSFRGGYGYNRGLGYHTGYRYGYYGAHYYGGYYYPAGNYSWGPGYWLRDGYAFYGYPTNTLSIGGAGVVPTLPAIGASTGFTQRDIDALLAENAALRAEIRQMRAAPAPAPMPPAKP